MCSWYLYLNLAISELATPVQLPLLILQYKFLNSYLLWQRESLVVSERGKMVMMTLITILYNIEGSASLNIEMRLFFIFFPACRSF